MINYWRILLKALLTGALALTLTLIITSIFVPLMGGKLAGAGLIMTIACPLATAIPMSALHYLNSERLRLAKDQAIKFRDELEGAYTALRKQSREDSLTGVLNRSTFLAELITASENQQSGGLLFIDLDHFKTINDTYGHATGDAALRRIGLLLLRLTEASGFVGRLGGEEFGVFVRDPDLKHIYEYAENIRREISILRLVASDNKIVTITASIGVTVCYAGFNLDQSLLEADEKMYIAKRQGRNLIVA